MLQTRSARTGEDKELLRLRENQFNDLKSKRIQPASLHKHFVAFANSDGGDIYVGVEDAKVRDERIIGFSSEEEANDHVKQLLLNTKPTVGEDKGGKIKGHH